MSERFPLTATSERPLTGLSVLVTRPLRQATHLLQSLQRLGASTYHQPCIDISPYSHQSQTVVMSSINRYDYIIFVSKNAVDYAFELFKTNNISITSPQIAAIGKTTRESLKNYFSDNIISPANGFDSEALLICPPFSEPQISFKKILIIRGGHGREHLKQTLEQRQASVEYLDVYQRSPSAIILPLDQFKNLDIITVSSQQGLENLLSMLDSKTRSAILKTLLITPSVRCANRAQELGFNQIVSAANATDDAMLSTIASLENIYKTNKRDVN